MIRCPMEAFTGMQPPPLLVRPSPFRRFWDLEALDRERCTSLVDIDRMHTALSHMHKELAEHNLKRRTQSQKLHNAKTHILPINIELADYVMIRTHAKREQKLQARWHGPMRVVASKSDLVFEVESIVDGSKSVLHAQRMVPYPVTPRGKQASSELKQQAQHYDTKYHLVHSICGIRKNMANIRC